jgi:hypothetical protein
METNLSRSVLLSVTKVLVSSLAFTLIAFFGLAYDGGSGLIDVQITSGAILSSILGFIAFMGFVDYFRSKKAFLILLFSPLIILSLFLSFAVGLGLVGPFLHLIPPAVLVLVLFSIIERFRSERKITLAFFIASFVALAILLPMTYSDLRTLSRLESHRGAYSEDTLRPMLRTMSNASLLDKLKVIDSAETGCDDMFLSSLRNQCEAEVLKQKSYVKWDLGVYENSVDEEIVRLVCTGSWNPECEDNLKRIITASAEVRKLYVDTSIR